MLHRNKVPFTVTFFSTVFLGLVGSSCGQDKKVQPLSGAQGSHTSDANGAEGDTNQNNDGENDQHFDDLTIPPQEYYDHIFAESIHNTEKQSFNLASGDQVLFVNFDGAVVAKGFNRSQSFIPCKQSSQIPAAQLSPADKQAVLDLVQDYYNDAGALLIVTAEKPASGDFTTIHVGGSFSDLGCAGAGILGVAPFDQDNVNKNDVGFAFTKNTNNNKIIAETIAHEAAHSFGLDHVDNRKDIMFASSTNEITGFAVSKLARGVKSQDGPALLQTALGNGTSTAGTVGTSSQNQGAVPSIPGIQNLPAGLGNLPGLTQLGNLGQLIPGISQVSNLDLNTLLAQALALIPQGVASANLPQFDKILAAIGLSAQAGANQQPQTPASSLGSIASLAGSLLGGSPTAILDAINAISGAAQTGNAGSIANLPAGLPDFAAILGLVNQSTTNVDLIKNLIATAQVINGNFSGPTQNALLSAIKVGYAQAYKQINGNK